jgi:hypothetical protein
MQAALSKSNEAGKFYCICVQTKINKAGLQIAHNNNIGAVHAMH